MSSARCADWRFLLPTPPAGRFEHLVVLGGSADVERGVRELGLAARVSRQFVPGDRADAVVVLAGTAVSMADVARHLDDDAVLYWEVDRRLPGQLTLTPARALRRLRGCGLTPGRTYWVKPGFPRRQMYLPLDAPNVVRWYLDTLYRAGSIPRRLFRTALRAIGSHRRGLGAVVPCYAVTACRGAVRQPALLEAASAHGIAAADRAPVFVAQGDYDWNRVAVLLFAADAEAPGQVIKLARLPVFNTEIEREHDCLEELGMALPASLTPSLPASTMFRWNDLIVTAQTCMPGSNLHSRAARGTVHAFEDVRLAADWLADFDSHTATDRVPAREWLTARVNEYVAEYATAYGLTAAEQHLFASVDRHLRTEVSGTLRIVWQHADFGPWNVYRDGSRISVIDWETARRGPALVDLLYFVTQWSIEFAGAESDEEQCRELEVLVSAAFRHGTLEEGVADSRIASIRGAVADYMQRLDVAPALLPPLVAYTFLEQAVDRMRRFHRVGAGHEAARAANCYVAYLDVLARHADRLCGRVVAPARAGITVAVATRNRPSQLARCIDAVLSGRTAPAEIVIVDQSDDTRTAARVGRADWHRRIPVRYLRVGPRGLAASRNAAAAVAVSPIVAFTDDDCVPDEGWLSSIAAAFDGAEHAGAVTGRILPLGPERPGFYAASTRDSRVRAVYTGRSLPWVVGSGGNTAVRREWLARVGGFDERLGAGTPGRAAEDTDLLYRLLCAGATVQYEPDAVVFHERKDSVGHLASRPAYGFGMGAFCALSARRRDAFALWMLARWCVDRARRLLGGCARRQWRRVREELLMLGGAWKGVAYGARAGWHQ